jgi:hypothetical protein
LRRLGWRRCFTGCGSSRVWLGTGSADDQGSIRQADPHGWITHTGGFSGPEGPDHVVVPKLTGIGHLPTVPLRFTH